jgi:hypothetical protein
MNPEAEQAGQADHETTSGDAQALADALIDAGYLAASPETIAAWSDTERDEARTWCAVGTIEALPPWMLELARDNG